jgi:hypothetical protein
MTNDSADENEQFKISNIKTSMIDIIRQYIEYKSQYKNILNGESFFKNKTDKFFIDDASRMYFDTKTSVDFTDIFLPIHFSNSNWSIIAVFGHK